MFQYHWDTSEDTNPFPATKSPLAPTPDTMFPTEKLCLSEVKGVENITFINFFCQLSKKKLWDITKRGSVRPWKDAM